MRFISPKRLTVLTATLLLGGVVFVLSSSVVMAQSATSLTDDQKQQIITGCVSVKNSLTQLHASDALLRPKLRRANFLCFFINIAVGVAVTILGCLPVLQVTIIAVFKVYASTQIGVHMRAYELL
jgi:hypothetical protein